MLEALILADQVPVRVVPLMLQLVPEVPVCPELLMVSVCPESIRGDTAIMNIIQTAKHLFFFMLMASANNAGILLVVEIIVFG